MDFSADVVADRAALLADAAPRLDRLSRHLGDGEAAQQAESYGNVIRDFAEDRAGFAASPDLWPLTDVHPVRGRIVAAGLEDSYGFWSLRIPLLLFARRNWAFNRLEVKIEFDPDERDSRLRAKAFDILPNRRFDAVLRAGTRVELGVGADGRFALHTPAITLPLDSLGELQAQAGAEASAALALDAGIGPIRFRAVAAKVDHTAEGLETVFWRLDGAEFFQENQPDLVVVVQVPRGRRVLSVSGAMQAYRRFNLLPAGLRAAVQELPEALRVFFHQGAPLGGRTHYELELPDRASTGTQDA